MQYVVFSGIECLTPMSYNREDGERSMRVDDSTSRVMDGDFEKGTPGVTFYGFYVHPCVWYLKRHFRPVHGCVINRYYWCRLLPKDLMVVPSIRESSHHFMWSQREWLLSRFNLYIKTSTYNPNHSKRGATGLQAWMYRSKALTPSAINLVRNHVYTQVNYFIGRAAKLNTHKPNGFTLNETE